MKKPRVIPDWVGKLTKTAFPRLVVVEWLDSSASYGWTRDEPPEIAQVHVSIGWVTSESKGTLSVSPHITVEDEPQRNGTMTIPKCCIQRVVDLL